MTNIEQMEAHKAQLKQVIARRDELQELLANPLFKKHITEGFCRDELVRSLAVAVDPASGAEERADALQLAKAGAILRTWIQMQGIMANQAQGELVNIDEALDQMRAEEDADEAGIEE